MLVILYWTLHVNVKTISFLLRLKLVRHINVTGPPAKAWRIAPVSVHLKTNLTKKFNPKYSRKQVQNVLPFIFGCSHYCDLPLAAMSHTDSTISFRMP